MSKSKLNISEYLHLKDVGFLEMVYAITPMLIGFNFRTIPMGVLMWTLLVMLVMVRGEVKLGRLRPMILFAVYWAFHDFAMMLIDSVNINNKIQQVLFFLAFFLLYPQLNLEKLRGSLNWVALIAIAGLLYQWSMIVSGNGVHPLEIPGLTMPEHRLDQFSLRPSSFFMEPAAYTAYMICPLAVSLNERKYAWSIAIILSLFLSTSTTGLILSFVMLGVNAFTNLRKAKLSTIAIAVIAIGLYIALINLQAFEYSVEKFETTDTEENVRLFQGPHIVSTMQPEEFLFGAPYSSPYEYCKAGRATQVEFYGESVYMSTLWYMILCYGIVGLVLYLNIYVKVAMKSRITWPLMTCLFATLFSSSYRISSSFIFILILLMVMIRAEEMDIEHREYILKD